MLCTASKKVLQSPKSSKALPVFKKVNNTNYHMDPPTQTKENGNRFLIGVTDISHGDEGSGTLENQIKSVEITTS